MRVESVTLQVEILMPSTSHTKRQAESRFRVLMDELKLLTMSFPHLRESYDKDDLPVEFILKRGADRAEAKVAKELKQQATPARPPTGARKKK